MNIKNLLQLLTEDRSIEYINSTLKDKVPQSVIDTLSSKMKKDKYDNIAMAIFHAIQEWGGNVDKERYDFLVKRAGLIYSALKEAGRDNPKFDPEQEMTMYRYMSDEESPMKYWSDFRSGEKKDKEFRKNQKKDVFGLPQARVKELPESYLFFPRNFKFDFDGMGFRISDLNKSHEDLKALSAQMAKKDTSGDVRYRNSLDKAEPKKATDNHWCVAANSVEWYLDRTYKGGYKKGLFVIIVDKNKDGSPNWNKRYLWWIRPDGRWEFADKFDDHVDITDTLPASTRHFLTDKIAARLGGAKGDEQRKALYNRAEKVYNSDVGKVKDGTRAKVNTQSATFKNYIKILRFLRGKYAESHKGEEGKGVFTELQNAMKKWASQLPLEADTVTGGAFEFTIRFRKGWYVVHIKRKNDSTSISWIFTDEQIKKLAQNINNLKTIKKHSWQSLESLEPRNTFKSKAYVLNPGANANKEVKDALKNNKLAIDMYEGLMAKDDGTDEIREFFIGPHFLVSAKFDGIGQNLISVVKKPWSDYEEDAKVIGDLGDKNIFEKVKAAYEELARKNAVAEGPEKA